MAPTIYTNSIDHVDTEQLQHSFGALFLSRPIINTLLALIWAPSTIRFKVFLELSGTSEVANNSLWVSHPFRFTHSHPLLIWKLLISAALNEGLLVQISILSKMQQVNKKRLLDFLFLHLMKVIMFIVLSVFVYWTCMDKMDIDPLIWS